MPKTKLTLASIRQAVRDEIESPKPRRSSSKRPHSRAGSRKSRRSSSRKSYRSRSPFGLEEVKVLEFSAAKPSLRDQVKRQIRKSGSSRSLTNAFQKSLDNIATTQKKIKEERERKQKIEDALLAASNSLE